MCYIFVQCIYSWMQLNVYFGSHQSRAQQRHDTRAGSTQSPSCPNVWIEQITFWVCRALFLSHCTFHIQPGCFFTSIKGHENLIDIYHQQNMTGHIANTKDIQTLVCVVGGTSSMLERRMTCKILKCEKPCSACTWPSRILLNMQ